MTRRALGCVALLAALAAPAAAQGNGPAAVELSIGTQGILSYVHIGGRIAVGGSVFLGLGARLMSSLTWATFIDQSTGEQTSLHPVVAGGVLSVGGSSPATSPGVRMYGAADLMLGHTFTPYDDLFYGTENLVGRNLTVAIWGYFGIEYFTGPHIAVFLSAGGGFKTLLLADDQNVAAVASSWLGSGFGIGAGLRWYATE